MGRSLTGTDDLVAFQIQRAKTQTIKKKERERERYHSGKKKSSCFVLLEHCHKGACVANRAQPTFRQLPGSGGLRCRPEELFSKKTPGWGCCLSCSHSLTLIESLLSQRLYYILWMHWWSRQTSKVVNLLKMQLGQIWVSLQYLRIVGTNWQGIASLQQEVVMVWFQTVRVRWSEVEVSRDALTRQ